VRGADDDDVLCDHGCAVPRDLAGNGIELLVGILLQVDDAAVAEVAQRMSGFGIQADELIPDRDVKDALVTLAIGPVTDAAA
jgi:hypothetical protein